MNRLYQLHMLYICLLYTSVSYHKSRYITYRDLRYVEVKYYNYKGKIKNGEMIVNKAIASDVVKIFYELYQIKYPIRRIRLVDEYDADDNKLSLIHICQQALYLNHMYLLHLIPYKVCRLLLKHQR